MECKFLEYQHPKTHKRGIFLNADIYLRQTMVSNEEKVRFDITNKLNNYKNSICIMLLFYIILLNAISKT